MARNKGEARPRPQIRQRSSQTRILRFKYLGYACPALSWSLTERRVAGLPETELVFLFQAGGLFIMNQAREVKIYLQNGDFYWASKEETRDLYSRNLGVYKPAQWIGPRKRDFVKVFQLTTDRHADLRGFRMSPPTPMLKRSHQQRSLRAKPSSKVRAWRNTSRCGYYRFLDALAKDHRWAKKRAEAYRYLSAAEKEAATKDTD